MPECGIASTDLIFACTKDWLAELGSVLEIDIWSRLYVKQMDGLISTQPI